jgi:hypothetical protein
MKKENELQIRNSTAEFLIFTRQAGEDGIEVRVAEETVWLTQKLIGVLFDKGRSTITEHLKNIFETGELDEKAVCRDFRHTAEDGKDYTTRFYNLDAIIAVGFRVNSARAIQFRQWATGVLRDYAIRGYVLDKERLKNGAFFSKEYFENLLAEIREIRASERKFYQKITDIYATAMDYSVDAEITQSFFATVQNKLHFAIHGRTSVTSKNFWNKARSEEELGGRSVHPPECAALRPRSLVSQVFQDGGKIPEGQNGDLFVGFIGLLARVDDPEMVEVQCLPGAVHGFRYGRCFVELEFHPVSASPMQEKKVHLRAAVGRPEKGLPWFDDP